MTDAADKKLMTKSHYCDALACDRRLWLTMNRRELAADPDVSAQRRMRQGQEVDGVAREHFPGGRSIARLPHHPTAAVVETQRAIGEGATRLYQPAFLHDGVLCVVDILERTPLGWHLIEVKAVNEIDPKKRHLDDVAIQMHVLTGAGVPMARASILHLNKEYSHPGEGDLFVLEDVTNRLHEADDVRSTLMRYESVLAEAGEPDIVVGSHCRTPHECPFKAHCWEGLEGRTIFDVQDMFPATRSKLQREGILFIKDIPSDYKLPARAKVGLERRARKGVDVDSDGLRQLMQRLEFPLLFFDFETVDQAIPRFPGTQPYEQVPFQYSLHILREDGSFYHREYLHIDGDDPRPALVKSLLEDAPAEGSVVAYNVSFEKRVLKRLAEQYPSCANELQSLADRLWDQWDVFKGPYRHHAFGASNSLKSVLPVLVPDLNYDELTVGDGVQAQVAFEKIVHRETGWQDLYEALREYCRLDTLAMVRIHEHLVETVARAEKEARA